MRNILPEYFIEKNIIYITDFYNKMKKKKIRKGSLFKESDEDNYYFTKDIIDLDDDVNKKYIIQYLTDGISKTILTQGFFNVEIDQTIRKGYVLDNKNNSLKYYSDNNSLIIYFSNSNSNNFDKKKMSCINIQNGRTDVNGRVKEKEFKEDITIKSEEDKHGYDEIIFKESEDHAI